MLYGKEAGFVLIVQLQPVFREVLQHLEGSVGRALVVACAVGIGGGVGEGVHRVAELDEGPVLDLGVAHGGDPGPDVVLRNVGIVRAVEDELRDLHRIRIVGQGGRGKVAVEGDDGADRFGAAAGEFEHRAAAEAEADRDRAVLVDRVVVGETVEDVDGFLRAVTHHGAVAADGAGGFARFPGVGGAHVDAIHVRHENGEVVVGDRFGLFEGGLGGRPHPVGEEDDSGQRLVLAAGVGVVDQSSLELGAVDFVGHLPRDRVRGEGGGEERKK